MNSNDDNPFVNGNCPYGGNCIDNASPPDCAINNYCFNFKSPQEKTDWEKDYLSYSYYASYGGFKFGGSTPEESQDKAYSYYKSSTPVSERDGEPEIKVFTSEGKQIEKKVIWGRD